MRVNLALQCQLQKALVALLAVGGVALAHADAPVVNAQALGVTESVLQYCGPLDRTAAVKLRERIKELVGDASEQQLTEVRHSDEYRKAYDSVVDFVGKVDEHNAKRVCSETPGAGS
jgi:hypothetical protein